MGGVKRKASTSFLLLKSEQGEGGGSKVGTFERIYFLNSKMAEASTFFNEENMKVIRNIFKEEFEKQKNTGNLISANFKITMEEIKKSQDEIKNLGKEICDLRNSLEFTENVLEEKVKKLEERCKNMETELQEFYNNQIDPDYIYNKLVDLEDRSRRCNLRIDGVTEKKGETWEHCEEEIQNVFKEKLGLENKQREHIAQKERRTVINQELLLVSFCLTSKRRRYLGMQRNIKVAIFLLMRISVLKQCNPEKSSGRK